ncbi:MAG: class I SAM-dependent methyltransferase [Anaerolineae bacterium]|nr:class I SAM-dependent methyltransferase [Anaerolineae bacterium]MDK1080689.1 class I SAM-dependent methyltransferase [Anaerolineae bacterium]MDK1117686.1 class I SAM-dependent methyltransferase [Anaerolineae bacterium]
MDKNSISKSGEYWQEHLLSWEASAYYKDNPRKANLWDSFSTLFRGDAMYVRMNAALDLLKPYINGMTILDVGCASGRFPFQLLNAGAEKIFGIDISQEAIQIANAQRIEAGVQDKLDFAVADVINPETPLPKSDLVTALGVIEYFDTQALSAFLGNLQTEYFFLDFPDISRRKQFPTWQLRQVYIRVNKLPGVYLYRPEEFNKLAQPFGFKEIWVAEKDGFFYITNLLKI